MDEKVRENALVKCGLLNDIDYLYHAPRKYYDNTKLCVPSEKLLGCHVAFVAVLRCIERKKGAKMSYLRFEVEHKDNILVKFNVFGNLLLQKTLHSYIGKEVFCTGTLSVFGKTFCLENPTIKPYHAGINYWEIIRPKHKGISEDYIIRKTESIIKDGITEIIPEYARASLYLPNRQDALKELHMPSSGIGVKTGIRYVLCEDLLYFASKMVRKQEHLTTNVNLPLFSPIKSQIIENLPYELTADQITTIDSIEKEMQSSTVTHALVQGDVGSGKSIVAFILMLVMAKAGYQGLLVAPTVILAKQHYVELSHIAEKYGVKVAFIGGKQTKRERDEIKKGLQDNTIQLVVGTQALCEPDISFKELGIVCVDEEHRFGMNVKDALEEKGSQKAHVISFSATPIPRSLASVLYSSYSKVYEIKTMPKGRIPIQTAVSRNQKAIVEFARKQIAEGGQVYIICPLIDTEKETSLKTVKEASTFYEKELGVPIGIVTGEMKREEAEAVIQDFKEKKTMVLCGTTVVEVGVNVPNATLIIIEDAQQFGIAQLHQLRGRVGRGTKKSYCILHTSLEKVDRLEMLCKTTNGFEIAEYDLEERGAGDLMPDATEQTGNNRFLEEALSYPNLLKTCFKVAQEMVRKGDDTLLIEEMEKRNDKIFVKFKNIKYISAKEEEA